MKNNRFIRLFCLLLALALSFSLLSACSESDGKKDSTSSAKSAQKTNSNADSSDKEDDGDLDTDSDDFDSDLDDFDSDLDDFDSDLDDAEEVVEFDINIYNSQKPITNRYRGASGTVYHAFGFMKDDTTGRVYTDDMMDLELSRLVDSGIHYARTRYYSGWIWDNTTNTYDFNKARSNYFFDYCKAMQDRNINVLLTFGWHFGAFVGDKNSGSINEVSYLTGGSGNDIYGETATYDWNKVNQFYNKYGSTYASKNSNTLMSKEDCLAHYKSMVIRARRMAYFYAETLKEAKARGIHNISHFLYMTEPSYEVKEDDSGNGAIPEGREAREYLLFCRTAKDYLTELGWGNAVKHMGPQQGSVKHGDGLLRWVLERDPDVFDVYDAHLYPSANDSIDTSVYYGNELDPVFASYVQPLKDVGVFGKKEFWVDEFYSRSAKNALGTSEPWLGLQNVVGFITAQNYGIANFSIWQMFDQLWTDQTNTSGEFVNGIHQVGSVPSLFVSSIPRGQYYLTSLFSKYNGYQNGTVYQTNLREPIDKEVPEYGTLAESDVFVSAVKLEDGNWTITVVNGNALESVKVNVMLEKAIGKTLYRHVENANTVVSTTAGRLADADKTYLNVKDKFTDVLPGGSVAVYTTIKG